MSAMLKKVRSAENVVTFAVHAPAVAAALTRAANRKGVTCLDSRDVSTSLADRIADAFEGKRVTSFEFRKHTNGHWYLLAHRAVEHACSSKPAAPASDTYVDTLDTSAKGAHECPQCMGTGRYVVGLENDKPKFGGGICYRCKGKGYTTPIDRRRNMKYQEFAAARAMGA